jgi:hypothetical protein
MLCSIDPQATSMLLPIAQASLIAAPLVFRREIRRTVSRLQRRPPGDPDHPAVEHGSDRSDASPVDDDQEPAAPDR